MDLYIDIDKSVDINVDIIILQERQYDALFVHATEYATHWDRLLSNF